MSLAANPVLAIIMVVSVLMFTAAPQQPRPWFYPLLPCPKPKLPP
jgi:hypothetical protein